MRLAVEGPIATVKDEDVVTEKLLEETAVWLPDTTVMLLVAAPSGTTNESVLVEKEETGAEIFPPPLAASMTCGVEPCGGVKLLSVTLTRVPIGPDGGLNPVIPSGPDWVIVAVVLAVLVPPDVSVTVNETWNVPAEEYVWVGVAPEPVALSPKLQA
jgi:hypothetical protein